METNIIFSLFIATVLGGLVGLEREMSGKTYSNETHDIHFWGVRSYALISLLGALCAWIDTLYSTHLFVLAWMGLSALLIVISYAYTAFQRDSIGVTSEYAAFIVYFLGIIAMMGNYILSVVLTIFLMVILSSKEHFQTIQSKITREEFQNAIKFGVIAFIILPLLPSAKFSFSDIATFFGIATSFDFRLWTMDFFNPYGIWFFVVAMSAIEFIAYILSKEIK